MHPPRWLLVTLWMVTLAAGQKCYWPNGGSASATVACPLSSGTGAAACCFENHYCMTNGLCLSPTEGTWYRGACTDQTFQTRGCPKYCDSEDELGGVTSRHAAVWACASRVFSCGSLDNCARSNFSTDGAFRALMNLALQTDLGSAAATATVTATSTSSSTASCAPNPEAGISTGAAAGIGAGVGVPLTIAVAALVFMLLREKKRLRTATATTPAMNGQYQQPSSYATTPSSWGKPATPHVPAAEVDGQGVPSELGDTTHGRHELPR